MQEAIKGAKHPGDFKAQFIRGAWREYREPPMMFVPMAKSIDRGTRVPNQDRAQHDSDSRAHEVSAALSVPRTGRRVVSPTRRGGPSMQAAGTLVVGSDVVQFCLQSHAQSTIRELNEASIATCGVESKNSPGIIYSESPKITGGNLGRCLNSTRERNRCIGYNSVLPV
jgi:hypothetical protein